MLLGRVQVLARHRSLQRTQGISKLDTSLQLELCYRTVIEIKVDIAPVLVTAKILVGECLRISLFLTSPCVIEASHLS